MNNKKNFDYFSFQNWRINSKRKKLLERLTKSGRDILHLQGIYSFVTCLNVYFNSVIRNIINFITLIILIIKFSCDRMHRGARIWQEANNKIRRFGWDPPCLVFITRVSPSKARRLVCRIHTYYIAFCISL